VLLDIDGTLLDIAPTPDSVAVAHECRRFCVACVAPAATPWLWSPLISYSAHVVADEHDRAVQHAPAPVERVALAPRAARRDPDFLGAWALAKRQSRICQNARRAGRYTPLPIADIAAIPRSAIVIMNSS
jgi:hypothetical protein